MSTPIKPISGYSHQYSKKPRAHPAKRLGKGRAYVRGYCK
ncbi:hypothetical protein PAGA_a1632 [Pseudoalteromonas agarivorans DSM 14585]|uniref:Uncharacterized protein n=1 Tax=Pseudoalteromonas agarivorans DSM 14585 TaxID=1312369 RepID=A0ACA8DVI8_9GAMM|nr:hypothetical protein PAGA_a1632 [Pseudoalteromonas agarivorans DSM 14585]